MRRGSVWRSLSILLRPWKRSVRTVSIDVNKLREGDTVELRHSSKKGQQNGFVDVIAPPPPIVHGTVVSKSLGEVIVRLSHTPSGAGSRERKLIGFSLDGPHVRADGSRYFTERYTVECVDGHENKHPQLQNRSVPGGTAKAGGASQGIVCGRVTSIDREGPMMAQSGQLWWVDWYTLDGRQRLRKVVFDQRVGHMCEVGQQVEFKLKGGKYNEDVLGPVFDPGEGEVRGRVVSIRRVKNFGRSKSFGNERSTDYYDIEVRPGVCRSCVRFNDVLSEPLCAEGDNVVVRVHYEENRSLTFLTEVLSITSPDAATLGHSSEHKPQGGCPSPDAESVRGSESGAGGDGPLSFEATPQ
eukprot:Hpha_TRINITY_DN33620_c0_g1::TRINITY_DN33620_c0_g1_i1::g.43322::m.43322